MRITSKGQITIPQEFRERFGFLPHTEVEFMEEGGALRLVRKKDASGRGSVILGHMRQHPGTTERSTDQILNMTRGTDDDSCG